MNLIYQAHSGVRYLVLLAGVVALILLVRGLLARTPYAGAARGATAAFAGLLHQQILLGVAVVVMGVWYSALMGHLVMMILAGATAGILGRWARTATDARPPP